MSESKGPDYTPEQMTEAASYWYNGRVVDAPRTFPPLLQRVADLIEPVVNAELRRRRRFKGEWTGDWKATVAAVNLYEGADSGRVSLSVAAEFVSLIFTYPQRRTPFRPTYLPRAVADHRLLDSRHLAHVPASASTSKGPSPTRERG